MRFARAGLAAALALVAALVASPRSEGQPVPPADPLFPVPPADPLSNAKARFALGCEAWNAGLYPLAARSFEELLKDHPGSELAPEAAYRVAATYVLQGKGDEAKKALDNLVRNYCQSPWAQLALLTQYEEAPLGTLADEMRKQARTSGKREDALAAGRVQQVYISRFTKGSRKKDELAYKMADCCLLAGDRQGYEKGMKVAEEFAKDSGWGKLAAIRLGGERAFRERMDELISFRVAGDEQYVVFLDLAGQFFELLQGDDRIKCQFYKARCLGPAKKADSLAIYQGIVKDHPQARWAAESAFWIAEAHFNDKEFDKAKTAFLAVAENYPQSPRATVARTWAGWIDRQDEACKQLERVLARTVSGLVEGKGGLALRLEGTSEDPSKRVQARVAFQSETKCAYLSLRYGQVCLLLASNKDGSCYQFGAKEPLIKSRRRLNIPAPKLRIDADDVSHKLSFWAGVGNEAPASAPAFQISPQLAPTLVSLIKTLGHLKHEVRADGDGKESVVFQFQSPGWDTDRPESVVLEVGPTGKVREVRWLWWDSNGKENVWSLSEVVLGETLPESAFDVRPPAGVEVRMVEELNEFQVFMEALGTLSRLVGDLQNERKAR